MSQRQYDAKTAEALMEFAFPEYAGEPKKNIPYDIRDDGVYGNESFRDVSPPGAVFDWTPADEMLWHGSPNPDSAPFLPIPFTAAQLAAAMLDGPGQSVQYAMERRIGYPLDDEALSRFSDRKRWVRDALQEAYAMAAHAQAQVGEFDYQEEMRAHELACQFDDANGQANQREGVFDLDATEDERRQRRARAVASVADLKAQAEQARGEVGSKWRGWRSAMVRALLAPAQLQAEAPAPAVTESAEQRQERRFRMCVDAGLRMPQDTYTRLPRGIGELARKEGITRQSFSEDVKAHIGRISGR